MKKKISFDKKIDFPTMIGEICSISLEQDLKFIDESSVEGNLLLSGKKKDEIIAKCAEFDIPCFTFPMAETWKKFGEYKKRNRTEEENKKACTSCCFGTHDLMFVDDKIYCCLRTLFASAIGEDTEEMRANTLDLDSNITLEQLQNFVDGKNLWRMCDYCDSPMEDVEPAEQL